MELKNFDEISGYNCSEVVILGDVINSISQKSGEEIINILHQQIILPMSSIWYAPEAVDFFNNFAELVKSKGSIITDIFDSFRLKVEIAGKEWAEGTGGEVPVLSPVEKIELLLSVEEILPNVSGNIILNEEDANKIIVRLSGVEEEIKSRLKVYAEELDAKTAFIGGDQSEALKTCFLQLNDEIHKIFSFLTEGEDSLQNTIKKVCNKYSYLSTSISKNFN